MPCGESAIVVEKHFFIYLGAIAMGQNDDVKKSRVAKLETDLKELNKTLPEHCVGTTTYIGIHHATGEHWMKIEEIEEEIKALKKELAQ